MGGGILLTNMVKMLNLIFEILSSMQFFTIQSVNVSASECTFSH